MPSPEKQAITTLLEQLQQALHQCVGRGSSVEMQTLTLQQARVLRFLHREPNTPMSTLAKAFRITKASANALVNRLVRQQWVKRLRDPIDGRLVRLSLTPKAMKKIDAILEQKQTLIEAALETLSPNDRRTFLQLLTQLATHIQSLT